MGAKIDDESKQNPSRLEKGFQATVFGFFAFCAGVVALINLVGVPMMERQQMSAPLGWLSLLVAAICSIGSAFVFFRE